MKRSQADRQKLQNNFVRPYTDIPRETIGYGKTYGEHSYNNLPVASREDFLNPSLERVSLGLVRRRALDEVEELGVDRWRTHNPLFSSYIREFDESFDRGIPMDLQYYVSRPGTRHATFEEDVSEAIFPAHADVGSKYVILKGNVGSGKTSLVRYLVERLVPNTIPTSLCIYLDAFRIFHEEGSERKAIEEIFLQATESALTNDHRFFRNKKEYFLRVLENLGYRNLSDPEIFEMGRRLTIRDVVGFLGTIGAVSHLLIVIDNIDENSRAAIQESEAFSFALWRLTNKMTKMVTILVPVRTYTGNIFFAQEIIAEISLPPLNEGDVVRMKLEQVRDAITVAANEFNLPISYTIREKHTSRSAKLSATMTKRGVCDFLIDLSTYLLSSKEPDVLKLLRGLSAGNLRILVSNVYDLISSSKLPFIPLFRRRFLAAHAIEVEDSTPALPYPLVVESLMAIGYPFYDVQCSNVANLFNVNSSGIPNDFQNTLVMTRLLCALLNAPEKTLMFSDLVQKLTLVGYARDYIDQAVQKCLSYGLVTSEHGFRINHFRSSTEILPTSAAELYVHSLLTEPAYLMYACEDTPMPERYIISIQEKDLTGTAYGNKHVRLRSVLNLIDFLKAEEELEKEFLIRRRKIDEQAFLREMGIVHHNRALSIRQLLDEEVKPKIRFLLGETR